MAGPRDAEITIIGGGAVGAAAAYFLARDGWRDIQLLEGRGLCEATSSQAAGFVGQARPTVERARLTMAAAEVYRNFERETGYTMDYRQCGAVRLALSDASAAELRQIARTAEITGLPIEFLTDAQLHEIYPVLEETESVCAALWSPTCGYLQPNSLVTAYVSAARDLGVTVAQQVVVTGIGVDAGAIDSVITEAGSFRTDQVIIAAGPWSAALARLVGLELPIVPVLHEYFVTEPVHGWHAGLPCLRIPEVQVYARGESDRVLCGGFENKGMSIDPREVSVASRLAARPNWDVLSEFAASLSGFAPAVAAAGVAATFQGWPAFSPDGRFVVGPVS
ncbi:MAG: NAD(P)/FAD-dependent oxidoreductase, partial [Streptosporangiaceae bacterium]